MKKYDLDIQRVSKDNKVNAFGKHLIEFCKNNDMLIMNGRAFSDKDIGAATCKDKSVVDYVICSSSSVALLSHFQVNEFCSLYSDAHNAIEFSLISKKIPTIEIQMIKMTININVGKNRKSSYLSIIWIGPYYKKSKIN